MDTSLLKKKKKGTKEKAFSWKSATMVFFFKLMLMLTYLIFFSLKQDLQIYNEELVNFNITNYILISCTLTAVRNV